MNIAARLKYARIVALMQTVCSVTHHYVVVNKDAQLLQEINHLLFDFISFDSI